MSKAKKKISKEEELFNRITKELALLRNNFKEKSEEDNFIHFFHIVRLFYSELFKLNYEFTFEELDYLMSKENINEKLKKQISEFNNSLTKIEFSPMEFNSKMFFQLMDDFTIIFNDLLKWKKEEKNRKKILEEKKKNSDTVKKKSLFKRIINPFKKNRTKLIVAIRKYLITGYLSLDSSEIDKAMQEYHKIGEAYSKLDSISKRNIKPEIDDFLNEIKSSKETIEKKEKKERKKDAEKNLNKKGRTKQEKDEKKTTEEKPLKTEDKERITHLKVKNITKTTKKEINKTKQQKKHYQESEKKLLTELKKEVKSLIVPELSLSKSKNDLSEIKKFYHKEEEELKKLKVPEIENLAKPKPKELINESSKKEHTESEKYGEILILIKEAYEELKKRNLYETVNKYHLVEDKYYELSDYEKERCYNLINTLYKAIIKLKRLYYIKEYHNEIADELKSPDALSE